MDDRLYKTLKLVAITLGLGWIAWAAYDNFFANENPHALALETGRKAFKDGEYGAALAEFETILDTNPEHPEAREGVARSLMQLGRHDEAMRDFDEVIARDAEYRQEKSTRLLLAAAYANRGILHDRLGNYRAAIEDYEKAAMLEEELDEGPAWLIRFLRNQPEQQATILQRAEYLRAQLALPEEERVLRVPEIDARQRPYNQ